MDVPEADAGTRWQVMLFDCSINPAEHEVTCEMLGLDGGNLIYQGVTNPKRTHVIKDDVKFDGKTFSGYAVYYAVPNGCKEYLIAFGNENTTARAIYKIKQ